MVRGTEREPFVHELGRPFAKPHRGHGVANSKDFPIRCFALVCNHLQTAIEGLRHAEQRLRSAGRGSAIGAAELHAEPAGKTGRRPGEEPAFDLMIN